MSQRLDSVRHARRNLEDIRHLRSRKLAGGITELTDQPFDRDKLTMASRDEVADAAHAALFPLNALAPHIALLGAAVMVAVLCERLRVDAGELHRMALRVLAPEFGHRRANASLESLRDFAAIRMAGEETTIC